MTENEHKLFTAILALCQAAIDAGDLSRCQVLGVLERKPCGTADEDKLTELIWNLYPTCGLTAAAISGVHLAAQRLILDEMHETEVPA
jgi:hypothetical protein